MLATGKWIEKRMNNQSCKLKLNTTELKQVSSQKILGVTIDQKLSFDDHIDELCNKLSQRIAVLSKIKWFLPLEQRKAFYNANMIKQTMLYASNVWSACSTGNLQRIFRLQNRSACIILDGDTNYFGLFYVYFQLWLLTFYNEGLRFVSLLFCVTLYK